MAYRGLASIASGLVLATSALAGAHEESKSATTAASLDQQKLAAVLAPNPNQPGRYVAALYFPGTQLLVVSSSYAAPAVLDLVTDLSADGLRPERNAYVFDSTYKNGADQMAFDGDWKAKKVAEADYEARFSADDAEYARMLTILADAIKASTAGPGTTPKASE